VSGRPPFTAERRGYCAHDALLVASEVTELLEKGRNGEEKRPLPRA
jgi:hypothetical protein